MSFLSSVKGWFQDKFSPFKVGDVVLIKNIDCDTENRHHPLFGIILSIHAFKPKQYKRYKLFEIVSSQQIYVWNEEIEEIKKTK